jgi:predicted NBD/HSP70 family sugar kinase
LNPTTVSSLVNELMEDGLIEEVGRTESTGGKPARQLAVRADAGCIVAVDLSSTPPSASRVDLTGDTVDRVVSPSSELRGEAAVRVGVAMAKQLVDQSSVSVIGVGIVSPGVVSPTGEVIHSVSRDWRGVPVGQIFNDELDLPVYVMNDHQAAALVEYGSNGRDTGDLIVVLVGEGVGAGLILNGQLFRGDASGAGELGHMHSPKASNIRCECGAVDCLETLVALPGIVRAAQVSGVDVPDGMAGWSSVVSAAEEGVDAAVLAIGSAGEALGRQLAEVVKLLDVHEIVVVGGIRLAGDLFLEPLHAALAAQEGWPDLREVHVAYGSPKADLLLEGAAAFVLHAVLGVLWV